MKTMTRVKPGRKDGRTSPKCLDRAMFTYGVPKTSNRPLQSFQVNPPQLKEMIMNRPAPFEPHSHSMSFSPHFEPLGFDDDSPEEQSAKDEPVKIIARMPNIEEQHPSLSHVGVPSFWNHFNLKRITAHQQNRLLWCIVGVLVVLLGWSLMKPVSSDSSHSVLSPDPEDEMMVFRAESSSPLIWDSLQDNEQTSRPNLDNATLSNSARIVPNTNGISQPVEKKGNFSILPTTSIDLTIDPSEDESLSHHPTNENPGRSVWDRNEVRGERETPWNRGTGMSPQNSGTIQSSSNTQNTGYAQTVPNGQYGNHGVIQSGNSGYSGSEYEQQTNQGAYVNNYAGSSRSQQSARIDNQVSSNPELYRQESYDRNQGGPQSQRSAYSSLSEYTPPPYAGAGTYSPDYSSAQYNAQYAQSPDYAVPDRNFRAEPNYQTVQDYHLISSGPDQVQPTSSLQSEVVREYSQANLREMIPATEVSNTFRGPQPQQQQQPVQQVQQYEQPYQQQQQYQQQPSRSELKTADNYSNIPRYDGYSQSPSMYSTSGPMNDPRYTPESGQRY
ncbi:MAG: hypothetical protein ACRC10_12875 [Thermoguttaceae bacterium]